MEWQFNPFAIVLSASAIIAGMLAFDVRKRIEHTPAASTFIIIMTLIALWSVGYAIELSSAGHFNAFLGVKIYYIGIVSVPVLFLIFAVQYGEIDEFLNKYTVAALFLIPSITLILNWSFEYHRLYYKATSMDYSSSKAIITFVPGPWFWVQLTYSYACMLGGTVILVKRLIQVKNLFRKQLILIIAGTTLPWIGSILDIFVHPFRDITLSPLSFILMGIIFYYAFYRKRFLDIIPIARDKIIESMYDGVLVIDTDGRIIDANPMLAEMTGLSIKKIIGVSAAAAFAGLPVLANAILLKTDGESEVTVTHLDKTYHHRIRRRSLFSPDYSLMGSLIIMSDMTELYTAMKKLKTAHITLEDKNDQILSMNRNLEKRVNDSIVELREKEELLTMQGRYASMGEMIDFIAHQWKQNLYAANLRIEAMKNMISRNEPIQTGDIESMEAAIKNMNDTLREFRNFVSPVNESEQSFLIIESVESAISLIRDQIIVDGVTVIRDYRDSPAIPGYRNELSQVVLNIINNALKISRLRNIKGMEINISLYRDNDDAVLSISDNGGGIDINVMPLLFNKFYSTTSGSGLGLYISRMIIEQHFNGSINARSAHGRSTFTMRFPHAGFTEVIEKEER